MMTANYTLNSLTGILHHGIGVPLFVRDEAERERNLRLYEQLDVEAQVKSGDYFIMLATILDTINNDISDYAVRMRIEDIVSDLIYLHENYDINKTNQTKSE